MSVGRGPHYLCERPMNALNAFDGRTACVLSRDRIMDTGVQNLVAPPFIMKAKRWCSAATPGQCV